MTAHDAGHIPWKELVVPQIVNFSLFVGLLIYLLRKPVKAHFAGKREAFEADRKKAEEAKIQAERQNFEVRAQLKRLEESASKSIEDAKKDSAAMKEKLISEARAAGARQEQEAHKMVEFEKFRAVAALRAELVTNATAQASTQLTEKLDKGAQSKLNQDFLNKMQAART